MRVTITTLGIILVIFFAHASESGLTRISGTMENTEGIPLAGVVVIEKGRLYGRNYQFGGEVDANGEFSISLPGGGDYAIHLYATGYIYHPEGIRVRAGEDNKFTFKLPPNSVTTDAPVISDVTFEEDEQSPAKTRILLTVNDPNGNLSHQVLGVNTGTGEGFIFTSPNYMFPWQRNYPNGIYTLVYDTKGRSLKAEEWIFVAADNRCYNSPVSRYPFDESGIILASVGTEKGTPKKDAAGDQKPLNQEALIKRGQDVFMNNCAFCHYADKTENKVGPGLKGLFKLKATPIRNLSVTEDNILLQIQDGGVQMPPYAHIKGEKLKALLEYLKSL